MVDGLRVRLFGDVVIERDGRVVARPPTKALELLCYLLLHRDRAHTRESLAEVLWPDDQVTASRRYLRQALWRLNAAVQDDGLVTTDPGWLRINLAAVGWSDVGAFDAAYAVVRGASGRVLSERQAAQVEAAVAAYRGDLLAAWAQDWCGHERLRLREAYLTMLERLMAHYQARGHLAKGLGYGQTVLRLDPARESAHVQLMQLHHRAGDRTAAIRQYEQCRKALAREFGVRPSTATADLYHEICADRVVSPDRRPTPHLASVQDDRDPLAAVHRRLDEIQEALRALHETIDAERRAGPASRSDVG